MPWASEKYNLPLPYNMDLKMIVRLSALHSGCALTTSPRGYYQVLIYVCG
jgi:hypothetical protein